MNMRVPFTTAQRQELERQITIYKYIMSPVPVPRQLLVPIYNTTTPSNQPTRIKKLNFSSKFCSVMLYFQNLFFFVLVICRQDCREIKMGLFVFGFLKR